MRLDFNVLWVDDQPASVQAQIAAISKQMQDHGFEFRHTLCHSMQDVRARLSPNVFIDEVDLILVDWDLGGGIEGQNAIAEIRESIRYKDVVFYSARTTPEELRGKAYNANLEGIYCAAREGLVDEVMGVFESLVKKVLDLDHTRGIVMGATSDIDYMTSECLRSIHAKFNEPDQKTIDTEALELIGKRIADLTKKKNQLQSTATNVTLMEDHMIFTANDRLRILSRLLENEALKSHKQARTAVIDYMIKVVPDRNILGHQVLVPEGKPKAVIDNKGNPINVEEMRVLRCLLLQLRNEFRNLLTALQANS